MARLSFPLIVLCGLGCALAAPVSARQQVHPSELIATLATQKLHNGKHTATLEAVAPQSALTLRHKPIESLARPVALADRSPRNYRAGIAVYGPFVVLDDARVALIGETDGSSPRAFRAMLRAYPRLNQLDMVECPGTHDDRANMELGRMIRAARMVTHVPPIGSVRSGAVELFFAGVARDISDGAEFAVHSWIDEYGREPADFAADAPENRQYLDYYREMGMSEHQARDFYRFTNSVPYDGALWLDAQAMRGWVAGPARVAVRSPGKGSVPGAPAANTPRAADAVFAMP